MVEGTTVDARRFQKASPSLHVPVPRTSPENAPDEALEDAPRRRHRAPALAELIATATMIIRRDSLAPSGYLVVQGKGGAQHQHAVWELGPFALLDDGWFGQVHGNVTDDRSKWLRKHERRCKDQHWTQFSWIDPSLLDAGCGAANIGLGLSPDGPTYCPGETFGEPHPAHVRLLDIFTDSLRLLGQDQS